MYIVLTVVFNVEKREDPKGTSQTSIKYTEEPPHKALVIPSVRRDSNRIPPLEPVKTDTRLYRRSGTDEDILPLISNQNTQRPSRTSDVSGLASVPEYKRSNSKEYPIITRKKSGPSESSDAGHYVGRSPEHEQLSPYVKYFTTVSFLLFASVVAILIRLISFFLPMIYALIS